MRQKKTEKKKQQSSKTAGYSAKQSKPRTLERKHSEKLKKTHLPVHTQLKDEWSAPWKLESAMKKKKRNAQRRMICPLKVRERARRPPTPKKKLIKRDLPLRSWRARTPTTRATPEIRTPRGNSAAPHPRCRRQSSVVPEEQKPLAPPLGLTSGG